MSSPTLTYTPQKLYSVFQKQAWNVWAGGLAVVSLWLAIIVSAPLAKLYGFNGYSAAVYHFYSFLCHQLPDRSLHIEGEQLAVCARCFGVYSGLFLGFAAYPFWRPIAEIEPLPRFWLFLSLVPMAIDWSLTFFGIWENTHLSRYLTGSILGFACATFIIPALVEITRNLKNRRVSE
jgi:uncharacterized membrane protein